jgi:hypothetical protein
MEKFYGGGGRSNPDFVYRFEVKTVSNEMYEWCEQYPLTGPFERWYIQYSSSSSDANPVIQFESRQAAYWFRIAYSEYILKDLTYSFARSINEPFN